jgi:hypothetical protein
MAQATSGEKLITVDGEKYKVRTQVVYQDGLGVPGTLSTTAPIRYTIEYKPLSPSPLQQWITLGERDNTNQNNWIFTPAAGAGFQKALIANGPNSLTTSLDDAASNALSKSSGVTKQQANQVLQVAPNVVPTAAAPVQPAPIQPTFPGADPNKPDPNATTISTDVLENLTQIDTENPNPQFTDLAYPTNIRTNGQDFIKFSFIKYVPRKLDTSGAIGILGDRRITKEEILGNVILPIQPSISDSNNVDWNGLGINPLEMEMTTAGLNLMSGSGKEYVDNLVGRLGSMTKDQNVINAVKLYFAQKAAGVSGLLSRVSGAIVNPNLELLFQGPTLRPFTFTFRLSPRDIDEATIVRQIIRAFKQYSAVGTTSNNLFLTAPNVFNIQYISRDNQRKESNHKSLNKIKTCALKSVNVDYTPDGSYMTFNDEARTMTSYNLSLQFQELEPVTTSDYKGTPYDQIGY